MSTTPNTPDCVADIYSAAHAYAHGVHDTQARWNLYAFDWAPDPADVEAVAKDFAQRCYGRRIDTAPRIGNAWETYTAEATEYRAAFRAACEAAEYLQRQADEAGKPARVYRDHTGTETVWVGKTPGGGPFSYFLIAEVMPRDEHGRWVSHTGPEDRS